MKKIILLFVCLISMNLFSQREWENVTISRDGCHNQVRLKIERRVSLSDKDRYEVRAIFENTQTTYPVSLRFKFDKEGSWSGITIPINEKEKIEYFGGYSLNEKINFKIEAREYVGLKIKHLSRVESYAKCGESANEILLRDRNKGIRKQKKENSNKLTNNNNSFKNDNTSNSDKYNDNTSNYNNSYSNTSTNTNTESIYQKRQREAEVKAEKKRKLQQQRMNDVNNFIDNQNRQAQVMKETGDELKNLFSQYTKSWAKENEFQNTISRLTRVNSTSINSIINEVRQKSKAINNEYSQKQKNSRREISNNIRKETNNAKTDLDKSIVGLSGIIAQGLSQNKIEKERRKKQQELEDAEASAINKLVVKFRERIKPRIENYKKLSAFSVFENEEEYYLEQLNYTNCQYEKAKTILKGYNPCSEPNISKPNKRYNISGKDYFNAYKRKKASSNKLLNDKAETMLELAIEKEPNNANYYFEKASIKKLTKYNYEKAVLLKKAFELDKNNNKIKEAYHSSLKSIEAFEKEKKIERQNSINSNSSYDWKAHSGLMRFTRYGKTVFIDSLNNIKLDLGKKYEFPWKHYLDYEFNQGLLKVQDKSGKYGFVNTKAEIVIPFKYWGASHFSEGLAAVYNKESRKWGFINKKEEIIIPFKYVYAQEFSEGLAYVTKGTDYNRKGEYINKKGETIINGNFNSGLRFSNGLAAVNNTFYINKSGKKVTGNFGRVTSFNKKGYAIVGTGDRIGRGTRWFIINKKGKKQHKHTFENKPIFINGIAKVNIRGLIKREYVFINEKGEFVTSDNNNNNNTSDNINLDLNFKSEKGIKDYLNENYDSFIKINEGYIVIKKDNLNRKKYGFFNKNGKLIIPVTLDYLGKFSEGLALFSSDTSQGYGSKYGYIDLKGEITIPELYSESSSQFKNGLAVVGGNKKGKGVINTNGKTIIPLKNYRINISKNNDKIYALKFTGFTVLYHIDINVKLKLIIYDINGKKLNTYEKGNIEYEEIVKEKFTNK